MKNTSESPREACRRLRKLDRWYGLLVVSGAVLVLLGVFVLDSLTFALVGTIPAIIAVLFLSHRAYCPYCGRYLRMKFGLPRRCPYCKKSLYDEDDEA